MIRKISRKECLEKYSFFPIRCYNRDEDEEECFYPKVISGRWIELPIENVIELTGTLATEMINLISPLGIEYLIFLGDTDQNWISKRGAVRKDYLPFANAVHYLLEREIGIDFNGAVIVSDDDLETFLNHFYTIVRCDASLPYFHFTDNNCQILGTIHYSGQIRIDRFNKEVDLLLERQMPNTAFSVVMTK